ncbi:hypothetical protein HDU93_000773 [Gonapodya sp. JEL0774]|nr:hypothetical protein HDU93_000773 [Gonapodya sp. JEL0774]
METSANAQHSLDAGPLESAQNIGTAVPTETNSAELGSASPLEQNNGVENVTQCDPDVVVAQLVDEGFPPEMITNVVSHLLSIGTSYTTTSLLDESLAWLLQGADATELLSTGNAGVAVSSSSAQSSQVDISHHHRNSLNASALHKPSKGILKPHTPPPSSNTTITAIDGARSWLSKHLPTNLATPLGTLVNTIRSNTSTPAGTPPSSSSTSSQLALLGNRVLPSDITPLGSQLSLDDEHARMSRRVRFSEHDVSVDIIGASHEEVGPEEGGGDEQSSDENRAATVSDVYNLYMTECESYRETPIGKLVEQMQESFEQHAETLTKIDLSGVPITNKNVLPLAIILSCDFGLKQLSLENCSLDDDTLKSQTLKYLDVSGLTFDRSSMHYLAHALAMGPVPANTPSQGGIGAVLEVLKLDNCRFRSSLLEVLSRSVVVSNLSYISLRRCAIDATGVQWVADMISPDEDLRRVRMRNRRSGESTRHIAGLGHLDVSENPLGQGVQHIAMALGLNSSIKHVLLRDCGIDSTGLRILAEALKVNSGMKVLNLSRNRCCGPSTIAIENLKDALAVNRTLEELDLSNTRLSSEGAITLAEALPLTRNLRRLDLSHNPINLSGLMALNATIRKNNTITSLALDDIAEQNQHIDGSATLLDSAGESSMIAEFCGQIALKCAENARLAANEEEQRRKMFEETGTDEAHLATNMEEEEEQKWEEEIASANENLKQQAGRLQEEQRSSGQGPTVDEPALTARGFDRDSVSEYLASAQDGLALIESILSNDPRADTEILEQLYLQYSAIQSRLLAAVNDNLVDDERTLMEILSVNDRLTPLLSSLESSFQRVTANAMKNSRVEASIAGGGLESSGRSLGGRASSAVKSSRDLFELGEADDDEGSAYKTTGMLPMGEASTLPNVPQTKDKQLKFDDRPADPDVADLLKEMDELVTGGVSTTDPQGEWRSEENVGELDELLREMDALTETKE